MAETLNGCFLSAEMSSTPQGQGDPVLPEDLGRNCAKLLLEEIHRVSTAKTHTYKIHTLITHTFRGWELIRFGSLTKGVKSLPCSVFLEWQHKLLCDVHTGFSSFT